jgi:hypothetical protein
VATAVRRDRVFLGTVRRGLLPLPSDHQPATGPVFGPLRGAVPPPLTGRVGVVATGGSGALASVVGVVKALEDSGTYVSVYLVCSGSALFGFPLGAGMPPEEVAELTASMRPGDYIDLGWREIAALVPALARRPHPDTAADAITRLLPRIRQHRRTRQVAGTLRRDPLTRWVIRSARSPPWARPTAG